MNKVNYHTVNTFYDDIMEGEIDSFCDTCFEHLTEKANKIIYIDGYEYINGSYEIVED